MIDLLNRIGFRQIAFGGEGGGGGGGSSRDMVTAPKTRLVQKQPHLLAYITPAEAALLKKNGGTGEMVNGIPAFRPVKGKDSSGKPSAGTGFSGGSSGGGSSSSSSSNPGDIAGGGYGSGNSGGNAGSSPSYDFGSSNDNNDRDDRQPTPPPPPPPAPAPITYDPYEDADLYDDNGYQQEYSGSNYGGSSNNSVFDADMLSKVTRGLGTPTTWVGNNTQLAYNANPNSRYDFDYSAAYDTEIIPEKIGALPSSDIVAGGLGVSPVPRPRPDNLIMGRSPIGPTVTVSAKDALTTPELGALPEGVTQQMITDSQNDGEYGYYNNDGSYVPKEIDKYNGAGPDYSGVRFASGGGAQFDKDGDRFITKEEIRLGEIEGKGFKDNFWSLTGRGLGGTPLGSGQDPTGVAKWAEKLLVPGGSTIRKLSPPAFERPLSSYDPNNPYADVGENAPNIWWEKGKTNPIGFEYKRTPDEVLADRTASREKAAIDAANEITNNDNDNGPRTRREDLYGTRMTTEEYRRRYKGGGGAALPAYMRKYASGKSIDELVRKVKVNGKDYFLTPDGRYIEPSAFTGAAVARDIDVVETGESEQYLESYNVIDESTGIITTYNTDGSIMEVFDPNFESEEA
jgi:hypothetical protein